MGFFLAIEDRRKK